MAVNDLGEAVLLNAAHNVEEILAVTIINIHQTLKEKNMLPRLRDLFNFMNSNRDETCEAQDFQKIMKDLLQDKSLPSYDQLLMRYKTQGTRIDFSKFIKDIEYCEQGISPASVWASELAANIMKGTLV